MDANAAGLRDYSGRALRDHLTNALFVRAAIECLPPELTGIADRVTVILPWGSLLAAVVSPSAPALGAIRALCVPGATLTAVVALDSIRDRAEAERLGIPAVPLPERSKYLAAGWTVAGFALDRVLTIEAAKLSAWPSSWARRLAHSRGRTFWRLDARATGTG